MSLADALDFALKNHDFAKSYIIVQKCPELIGNTSVEPEILEKFALYAHKKELKEKMFVLRKGHRQENSIIYGAPLEILEQHIFSRL